MSVAAAPQPAVSAPRAGERRPGTATAPRPEPEPAAYVAAVAEALRRIRAGELRKVVLARSLVVARPPTGEIAGILRRLRARDPLCHVFAASAPDPGGAPGRLIAGATPELLVRRTGNVVVSTPLAGSAPRSPDATVDRAAANNLLASAKDDDEHRIVVEAVADTLAPLCSALSVDPRPTLAGTATVWHLATTVRGVLRPPEPSALALAAALHPTPAVCGTPRAAALRAIAELEPVPRGLYSGIVGWVDGSGDGEWVVCLRCIEVRDGEARLFAGAGIVEGSDPAAELAETEPKFRALLDALAST